jgi:hypothetical protein
MSYSGAAFGTVGHLLTNTNYTSSPYTGSGDNYFCVSATSTLYVYRKDTNGSQTGTNAGHDIKYNVTADEWRDGSSNNWPMYFGSTNSNGASSITPNGSATVLHLFHTYNNTNYLFSVNTNLPSSGPTVTQTRTAHSGIIPSAVDFTIRNPSPGDFYTKTGAGKFKIKFLDQNEPATYVLRVTWTTLTGTIEDTQTITQGSGDIELEYTGTSPSNTPVYGPITLQIDQAIYNNGQQYIANTTFKTFTYHETGPFTASFSPDFGLPGQSVNVIVTDTNPFPDETSHFWYRGFDGTVHANDHNFHIDASGTTTGTTTFTSTHGNYNLYKGTRYDTSSLLATANYDTNYVATTTSNGGGKPDRYPLIMTNLFNRNRSLYSIGMTHKDTWDLFL